VIKLVTRYKDRRPFLERTIHTWLRNPFYQEIIIVDWSSSDDIVPYLKTLNDSRLTVLRVKGQKYIDRGAAWNVGIKYADSTWIHAVDCDVMVRPTIYENVDFSNLNTFYMSKECSAVRGSCLFPKYAWRLVNGYIEGLKSFGAEDPLFYENLELIGLKENNIFTARDLFHITHGDYIRQQNHEVIYKGSNWMGDAHRTNWRLAHELNDPKRQLKKYETEIIKS
jgi:hypothetical protein